MAEYQYAILGTGIALAIMINVIIKRMHTSLEKSWAKDCVAYSPAFFCEIALICLIAVTVCLLFFLVSIPICARHPARTDFCCFSEGYARKI